MRAAITLLILALGLGTAAACPPGDVVGSRHVSCFSGGVQILDDLSDPKGDFSYSRQATTFLSLRTHRHVAIAADCMVDWP